MTLAEYIAQQWALLREHGLIKGEWQHETTYQENPVVRRFDI